MKPIDTMPHSGAPVVFLMGPTGAGKTRAALKLARRLEAEIISVDSALVYRGLNVGSAKPTPFERAAVKHHLIDICDPSERYSAARFRDDAVAAVSALQASGRVALLVGGTGLYFRAFEHGLAQMPNADAEVRAQLAAELERDGATVLHQRLARVDAAAAARIHPNDPQRVSRALEVYRVTGKSMTQLWADATLRPFPGPVLKLIIAPANRAVFHQRLAARFDDMLERGLLNEVRALRARRDLSLDLPALRAVGYREVWRYLDDELDHEQMRERAVIATRQLAKRQMTWLRKESCGSWFDSETAALDEQLLQAAATFLRHPK